MLSGACGFAYAYSPIQRRLPTSSTLSLMLSLLFAIAQVGAGAFVAWRLVISKRWRQTRYFALLTIALWFLCSGLAELLVSGMEATRRASGAPSLATFTLWRARADNALLAATILLLLALVTVPLARRLRHSPPPPVKPPAR